MLRYRVTREDQDSFLKVTDFTHGSGVPTKSTTADTYQHIYYASCINCWLQWIQVTLTILNHVHCMFNVDDGVRHASAPWCNQKNYTVHLITTHNDPDIDIVLHGDCSLT